MRPLWYRLADDGRTPIPTDVTRLSALADHHIPGGVSERNGVRVSTVFLGLDHSHSFDGPPVLWETMVFGGKYDGEQERYSSFEAAQCGHQQMIAKVFGEDEKRSIAIGDFDEGSVL